MTILKFKHKGGSELRIKNIIVRLTQSCEPVLGTIARMGYTEGRDGGFMGDLHDSDMKNIKVR